MAKKPLTAFGIEVEKALIDRRMTKTDLAEMIGTSYQYLYNILTGQRSPGRYEGPIREVLELEAGHNNQQSIKNIPHLKGA